MHTHLLVDGVAAGALVQLGRAPPRLGVLAAAPLRVGRRRHGRDARDLALAHQLQFGDVVGELGGYG